MLLLMKDGVNLFKKEDQKYNLISYTNEEELTLKEVLLDKLNFSVRSISKMKREQSVFVNGVFKKPSTKLKKGDLIEVKIEEEMANFEPQNLNLNILYDDFDIIMVNKPPFMVVHPTKSHFDNTIANGITYYIKEKNENVKVRFVNRLDMNTSGLVIVAKNAYAHLVMIFDDKAPYIDNKFMADTWGHGFTTTKKLEDVDNVGAYLTAYLGDMDMLEFQNLSEEEQNGMRIFGIKEVEVDGVSKSILKGARLHMYPPKFNLYRASRGIKKPVVSYETEKEAQKKVSAATLTFEKTIELSDSDSQFSNTINYRHYNLIRK